VNRGKIPFLAIAVASFTALIGLLESEPLLSGSSTRGNSPHGVASAASHDFGTVTRASQDSTFAKPAGIVLAEEFGAALEDDDSFEMVRVNAHAQTLRTDRAVTRCALISLAGAKAHAPISPPLLV